MPLWSASAVLRVLVGTPPGHDCDPLAYALLLEDLKPDEGLRRLFEPRDRLSAAARRLAKAGFSVNEDMLEEACNLILGRVEKNLEGRAKVRRHCLFFHVCP